MLCIDNVSSVPCHAVKITANTATTQAVEAR